MPIIVDLPTTPGTGLDLCAVWLNDAADLADMQGFEYVGDSLSANTTARVEVRQLANRRRLIRQGSVTGAADSSESMQVTFVRCDRDQVAWLRSKVGGLLCIRDHVGTKFYGTFAEAPREVATNGPDYRDRIDVKLAIDEVTYSEAIL